MKKIQLFLLAACTVFSCSDNDIIQNQEPSEEYTDILYASAPGRNSSDTKINIDLPDSQAAEATIQWVEGDAFNAYQLSTGKWFNYKKIATQQSISSEAAFGSTDAPADFTPEYAVFPSWLTESLDQNKQLTVTFPAKYNADAHPSQNIPMLAKVEGKSVHFKHLCGVLRANFQNLPEGFNTVKIVTNRRITGKFTVHNVSAADPVLESAEEQHSDSILVTHTDNQGDYYFPLPVGKYDEIHVYVKNTADKTQPPHQIFDLANVEVKCGNLYNITKNYLLTADHATYVKLLENIVTNNKQNPDATAAIDAILSDIQSNGSFRDIKYDADGIYDHKNDVTWPSFAHLENVDNLSRACLAGYRADESAVALCKAISFWVSKTRFATGTWFKTKIDQPSHLLLPLLRLEYLASQSNATVTKPDTEIYKKVLNHLKRVKIDLNPFEKTGSNRAKIAINWVYRACLSHIYAARLTDQPELQEQYNQEASKYISAARNSMFSSIAYTTEEGFQHDGSFFQHGQQLYIWGYGAEMLKDATDFLVFLQGTPFSISGKKLEILRNFVLNAYYPTLRGKYTLFNVLGRSIARPKDLDKHASYKVADKMYLIDPEARAEYQRISFRIQSFTHINDVTPYHHHFFRGDYTVHVRPEYTFGVRMVSKHTARQERGNGENLKGYFVSDGSTSINVTGDEYYNIFPTWNWSEVPGVTAPAVEPNPFPQNDSDWGYELGSSKFAGGVSNGLYGASAYAYNDSKVNIKARKSWFFFDQEVVCTGSVNTPNAKTTINQCLNTDADGNLLPRAIVKKSKDAKKAETVSTTTYTNPDWIYHRNIGYVFPQGGKIWTRTGNQSGNWKDINKTKSASDVNNDVFALGFSHEAISSTYAYIVVPDANDTDLDKYLKADSPVQIIQNDNGIQSVYHSGLKIWQTVFFINNYIKNESNQLRLSVDKPCVVMIKETDANYEIHVADPSRSQSTIHITLKSTDTNKTIDRTITLQGGACAGATATTTIAKSDL